MSGEVDFYVDGDPVRLRAGGMVVVPPNVMHHAVVIGDEPVMNLDIFTPKRAEYVTSR
jgi:quercetin dioxygenase-like cupin family protein